MWAARGEPLTDRSRRYQVDRGSSPATVADVAAGWRADGGFQRWFNAVLADVPFPAFRWETPAATDRTAGRPFEFVVRSAPELELPADPSAFAGHFRAAPAENVVTFPNLGGDAVLVVPTPGPDPSSYAHLAAFVRSAPEAQRDGLWRAVGEALAARLGGRPVWLSTAGAGVAWLHVRLDDRPKYYGHEPYRLGVDNSPAQR